MIKVSVEPKTKADQEKMTMALVKLAAEDPSFRFSRDEDSGQTVIEGMGELPPRDRNLALTPNPTPTLTWDPHLDPHLDPHP